MRKKNFFVMLLGFILAFSALPFYPVAASLPSQYGDPVNLGPGPLAGQAQGAAIGDGEIYFANSGSPAVFYAVDSKTGEVNFKQAMPGLDVVWAVTIGSDGNVYFAGTSNGIVYRYLPKEKKIENLGTNGTGDKWVWELEASSDGKVYGATYPQGKVFELDTSDDTFKDLGRLHPEQQYTRGLGVTDDAVYAGTGSTAYLYRIDRKTYEKTEIPTPVTGDDTMISNIWEYNDRLFVVNGTSLHILDLETKKLIRSLLWSEDMASDGFISPPSPYDSNIVYFKNKNTFHLWSYNMATDELAKVEPTINMPTTNTKTMKWIKKDGKDVLAMVSTRNEYTIYDPEAGTSSVIYPKVDLSGLDIQALEAGPDGNIYLSGYQGSIAVYDTKQMKYTLQERDPHQIEGMGFLNGKVYMGAYGGARIYEYDPTKPYAFSSNNETNNPKQIYAVPELQSRPFAFASGDDMLFTGTIPDYGKLGGTFAMYDSKNGKWDAFENIVPNQSIIGLAYNNGKVFGGTGIWGGLGIDPSESASKMFEFDTKTKKSNTFELGVPGLKTPQMIGELSIGPDKLLWGAAFGKDDSGEDTFALFAMDPETKAIKKHKLLMQKTAKGSSWRPFFLRWGEDGFLYTTIARQLLVIDPETLTHTALIDGTVNLMDFDNEGNIYYAKGSDLYKLPLIAPEEPEQADTIYLKPVQSGKTASAEVSAAQLEEAFRHASKNKGVQAISIKIGKLENADAYSLTLPTDFLAKNGKNKRIRVITELASAELQGHMLSNSSMKKEDKVTLNIAKNDSKVFPEGAKAIDLGFMANGEPFPFHHPGADVEIFIPYSENSKGLAAWKLENGNAVKIPNASYDSERQGVAFRSNQFGSFAAGTQN